MFKINVTKVIKPVSHFIESIEVDGNKVTVKMKKSKTLYHYEPSANVLAMIKKAKPDDYGKLYNEHLKGHSVSKTVFADEATA